MALGLTGSTLAQTLTLAAALVVAAQQRVPGPMIVMLVRAEPAQIVPCGVIRRYFWLPRLFASALWYTFCLPSSLPSGLWYAFCLPIMRHAGMRDSCLPL